MQEIVQFEGKKPIWAEVVSAISDALNPLGAAAETVSHIGACITEIRRFKRIENIIARQQGIIQEQIWVRQVQIIRQFELERDHSRELSVQLGGISRAMQNMVNICGQPRIELEQRIIATETIAVLSGNIGHVLMHRGDNLVKLSEVLQLGPADFAIANWQALEGKRDRSGGQ
ncbi:hypothetical protein [Glycomyces paridis]|nr:hypothetical protein [Glycomyces paridis]